MIDPLIFNDEKYPTIQIERPVFCNSCLSQRHLKDSPGIAVKFCNECPTSFGGLKDFGAFLCKTCDETNHRSSQYKSHVSRNILVVGPGVRKKVILRGDGRNFPFPLDLVKARIKTSVYHNGRKIHSEPKKTILFYSGLSGSSLHIQVLGGRKLLSGDFLGSSDPFVIYSYSGKPIGSTRVRPRTLNPSWNNETFIIPMSDTLPAPRHFVKSQKDMIKLEVFDYDWLSQNEFLGHVEMSRTKLLKLALIAEGKPIKVPLTLQEHHGLINIQLGLDHEYVYVKVNSAENLDKQDLKVHCSPYVNVYLGAHILLGSTSTKFNSMNPLWEGQNIFKIKISQVLYLEKLLMTQWDYFMGNTLSVQPEDMENDPPSSSFRPSQRPSFNIPNGNSNGDQRRRSLSILEQSRKRFKSMRRMKSFSDFKEVPEQLSLFRFEVMDQKSLFKPYLLGKSKITVDQLRVLLPTMPSAEYVSMKEYKEFSMQYVTKLYRSRIKWWDSWYYKLMRKTPPLPHNDPTFIDLSLIDFTDSSPARSTHVGEGSPFKSRDRFNASPDDNEDSNADDDDDGFGAMNKSFGYTEKSFALGGEEASQESPLPEEAGAGKNGPFEQQIKQAIDAASSILYSDTNGDTQGAHDNSLNRKEEVTSSPSRRSSRQGSRRPMPPPLEETLVDQDKEERDVETGVPYNAGALEDGKDDHSDPEAQGEERDSLPIPSRSKSLMASKKSSVNFRVSFDASADMESSSGSPHKLQKRTRSMRNALLSSFGFRSDNDGIPIAWSLELPLPLFRDSEKRRGSQTTKGVEAISAGYLILRLIHSHRGQVIRGIDEAVQQMSIGESAKVKCRYDYAYGNNVVGRSVPPRSNMVFRVDLLEINGRGKYGVMERVVIRMARGLFRGVMKGLNFLRGVQPEKDEDRKRRPMSRMEYLLSCCGLLSRGRYGQDGDKDDEESSSDGSASDDEEKHLLGSDDEGSEGSKGDWWDAADKDRDMDEYLKKHDPEKYLKLQKKRADPKMRKHLTPAVQMGANLLWIPESQTIQKKISRPPNKPGGLARKAIREKHKDKKKTKFRGKMGAITDEDEKLTDEEEFSSLHYHADEDNNDMENADLDESED